ncbi:MAG: hypothetical protein HY363_04220 [Candidatus Aenigmarchaeota archaeon]|nr:hypothetical protein [Candidatus Aenigmarchaeota archaeon]
MTILVACLLTGKGTWAEVTKLTNNADWEKILLVTNDFGQKNYSPSKADKTKIIAVDDMSNATAIRNFLQPSFDGLFGEVAVNLTSGTGNVHMAVLSALLKSGAGIRLVIPTETGFEEL